MSVNLLPIIIPLLLGWIIGAGLLFCWRLWAGTSFMGLSLALLIVFGANTNVEHKFDEEMPYRIVGSGRGSFVEFTTSSGEIVTESSENVVAVLEGHSKTTARVSMKAWYDFGKLRAYEMVIVEGQRPNYQPWSREPEKPKDLRKGNHR